MLRCLLSSCIHTHLSSWHVLIHIWVRDMYWYTPEFVALILGSWYLERGGIATAMCLLSSWHVHVHIWVRDICGYTSEFVTFVDTHLSSYHVYVHIWVPDSTWLDVWVRDSMWLSIWVRDICGYTSQFVTCIHTFESLIVPHSTSEFVTCIDFKSEFVTFVDTQMSSLHVYIWVCDSTPLYF